MNLRHEVRKANLAKWKAQGPALIARPLKVIHNECPDVRKPDGTFDRLDPTYAAALTAANRGRGHVVKAMARNLVRKQAAQEA